MRTHFDAAFYSLVVVREGDRYLLVEELEPDGRTGWYLPAGSVKSGESFLTAAIRETREEAGVDVELQGLLAADQVVAENGVTTKVRAVFLAKAIGGRLKSEADKESLRAAWFLPSEISRLPLRDQEFVGWIRVAEGFRDHPLPKFVCY